MLPLVDRLLKHDQAIVRKKTVMLLHHFFLIKNSSVTDYIPRFRTALCDKDPSVMAATLHVFFDLARVDPHPYKDLVSSFVSILKQVTEHRLPRDFDYHRVPAPWIQIKILKILAILGHADQASSEQTYEVLLECMRRADTGINVGYAIIYECVRVVTSIYPNPTLLDAAAAAIARFIEAENQNLRYLGVTGLTSIVKDHPKYAMDHQKTVIECLADPDESLKRKTLDLLFHMTNGVNVGTIVSKLLEHLKEATDRFLRRALVHRIAAAAEKFAPDNGWYVSVVVQLMEMGGDLVEQEVVQSLIRLVAEGEGDDDEEADDDLRSDAVETMLQLIDKPALPNTLLQVMFWVLGEYGYLAESMKVAEITDKVCLIAGRASLSPAARSCALSAMLKLTA